MDGFPADTVLQTGTSTWTSQGSSVLSVSASSTLSPQALVALSGDAIDVILGFDAVRGQARSYFSDPPKSILNSLSQVDSGHGYWVHTSQAVSLSLAEAVPLPLQHTLVAGWNLLGWQAADARPVLSALSGMGAEWDVILGFDAAAGQARAYFTDPFKSILNSLTTLTPGAGYWLHATQPTTWSYSP